MSSIEGSPENPVCFSGKLDKDSGKALVALFTAEANVDLLLDIDELTALASVIDDLVEEFYFEEDEGDDDLD